MGVYEELKIYELEKEKYRDYFYTNGGLDIVSLAKKSDKEGSDVVVGFYDYAGEYYRKPEYFAIGKDKVYKKKQYSGEVVAELILGYAYNELGIPSPIAYPFFMHTYYPSMRSSMRYGAIPDGVITKDVLQVYPTAEKRGDVACHTIKGLFTDDKCLETITKKGRMARLKEIIASVAFNNKDAGFDNSFWTKDEATGKHDGIISIDHGYSGRDSMYGKTRDEVIMGLYAKGEHGYPGMYYYEEDRATVLYFLRRLLSGQTIDGVTFSDDEIRELKSFIEEISRVDFRAIANMYQERFKFKSSPIYMNALEWSREELCEELGDK